MNTKTLLTPIWVLAGCSPGLALAEQAGMSFFINSNGPGKGGDLGGLAGTDAHWLALAVRESVEQLRRKRLVLLFRH